MAFPPLDLPTLLVVSTIGIAFSGIVLSLAAWRDEGGRALGVWGAASLVAASGLAAIAGPPLPSAPYVLMADALLTLSSGLCWTGARIFSGRKADTRAVLAGPAALLAFAAVQRIGVAHIMLTLLLIGGYTVAAALTICRTTSVHLRSRNTAIALLLCHAGFQFVRVVLLAAGLSMYHSHGIYAAVFVEALLFAIGMSTILLAMMKEKTQLNATRHLRQMTMADELTGLGNRRKFDTSLAQESRRAARVRQPLALLMIDVDHFKSYNDTYGHLAGDACLRAIAGAIGRAARRPGDVATRFGGEEFAVLLTAMDEPAAMQAATQIHAGVAALRIKHAASPTGFLTVSAGVASVLPTIGDMGMQDLVRQSDWALYLAKSEGRNCTRPASASAMCEVLRATG